jgi:HSP20 family protein
VTAVTRWNPFEDLASFSPRDLFGRDFLGWLRPDGEVAFEWRPRADLTESENEIMVHAELPGVDPKDIEVTVEAGMLSIRGEKRGEKKEEQKGRMYNERFFGSFERRLTLPAEIDDSKIEAKVKDGVLRSVCPGCAEQARRTAHRNQSGVVPQR